MKNFLKSQFFVWIVVSGLIIGMLIFLGRMHRSAQTDVPKTPVVQEDNSLPPPKPPCKFPIAHEDFDKCEPKG